MIEIVFLDAAGLEKTIRFDSYDAFQRSQQTCMIGVADHYKVVSLTVDGQVLDYQGTYGDIFFYLLNHLSNNQ